MHGDVMDAVANFSIRVGNALGAQAAVDRLPRLAASSLRKAPAAEMAMYDPRRVAWIEDDRVQAEPAGAWRPVRAGAVAAKARQLLPALRAVGRLEERGILDAGVDHVRIGQRRLEVPDPLELPRMRRAVVPLVRAGNAVVDELVADRLPRLAAVVRALNELAEPAGGLRRVDAGSDRRAIP